MTSSSVGSRKTHTAMISMVRETPPKRRNMKGMRSNTFGSVKYLKGPTFDLNSQSSNVMEVTHLSSELSPGMSSGGTLSGFTN